MFPTLRRHVRLTLGALALTAGAVTLTGILPASADSLGAFTCADKAGGVAGASGTVYDVKVAHHDGYDRLVIGFPTAPDATSATSAPSPNVAASTAAGEPATPSDLAATGHPAQPAQPANSSVIATLILGLLTVTAGLAFAGIRRFARK